MEHFFFIFLFWLFPPSHVCFYWGNIRFNCEIGTLRTPKLWKFSFSASDWALNFAQCNETNVLWCDNKRVRETSFSTSNTRPRVAQNTSKDLFSQLTSVSKNSFTQIAWEAPPRNLGSRQNTCCHTTRSFFPQDHSQPNQRINQEYLDKSLVCNNNNMLPSFSCLDFQSLQVSRLQIPILTIVSALEISIF